MGEKNVQTALASYSARAKRCTNAIFEYITAFIATRHLTQTPNLLAL